MSALARISVVPRTLTATRSRFASTSTTRSESTPPSEPLTHFRITQRRSAIALPERYQATLISLGLHKRMQTVYHRHSQSVAGKILLVKELVEVENVPESAIRTRAEQRAERRPPRGYSVVGDHASARTAFAEGVVSEEPKEEVCRASLRFRVLLIHPRGPGVPESTINRF